jgi:hypothetical protein
MTSKSRFFVSVANKTVTTAAANAIAPKAYQCAVPVECRQEVRLSAANVSLAWRTLSI